MLASRQILASLQQRLLDANTDAGARVYVGRGWPVDVLPAIKVFATDEDLSAGADDDITWPRQRMHTLSVDVQCLARSVDDPEAASDALALQVLVALEGTLAATTLDPLQGVTLYSTRLVRNLQSTGEAATAQSTVSFEVLFHTSSSDPETLI